MTRKNIWLRFLPALLFLLAGIGFFNARGFRFSGLLCFAAAAVILIFCILSLIPGKKARILRNTLLILVAAAFLLAIGTEIYIIGGSRGDPGTCRYLIVLGAGLRGTEPSLILQDRLNSAADYLNANPDTICIVSGGQGPGEDITEAQCMFRELTARGIAPERIWLETRSTSTAENIRFSLQVIESHTGTRPETAGILSNEFHLRRAAMIAADENLTARCIPAETSWTALRINYYIREAAALWFYILFGG